jgi:hypothetical protein
LFFLNRSVFYTWISYLRMSWQSFKGDCVAGSVDTSIWHQEKPELSIPPQFVTILII